MPELPQPYSDYLYIEPVRSVGPLAQTLNEYGKVLAIGPMASSTQIGDLVAFEKWDKPEFIGKDEVVYHFIREANVIARVPQAWV